MIETVQDFDDETAWERMAISFAVPLMPLTAQGATLDLRGGKPWSVTIAVLDSWQDQSAEEWRRALLPLLFGAAWKVLDLALELALHMGGEKPCGKNRWKIKEKTDHATARSGALPGVPSTGDMWAALTSFYVASAETRHALVHRRVAVTAETLELVGRDEAGKPLRAFSLKEQLAFCGVAQRLANGVIEGRLASREQADLRRLLTELWPHHGVHMTGPASATVPVTVIADLPGDHRLDTNALRHAARSVWPWAVFVDVELHVDDGRILLGEIEDAPTTTLDLGALPDWLRLAQPVN